MIAFFGFKKRPYNIATLYYNWLKLTPEYVISEMQGQPLKAGIYYPGDFEAHADCLDQYYYLNWSEEYWTKELHDLLFLLFDTTSMFESTIDSPNESPQDSLI